MDKCFSIACPITGSPPRYKTWRNFSMFEVTVQQTFAAGHSLRNYKGKCENVHGHNYKVDVTFRGEKLDATGLLVDFVEVKRLMNKVVDYLDHRYITN